MSGYCETNMTASIYPISKLRYDTLAGYTRRLGAYVLSEELAWYEASNGRVVGTLIRDTCDDDFGGIIMGRDEKGCFRCVEVTLFCVSPEIASNWLKVKMHAWSTRPPCDFAQGDATGKALSVFTPIVVAHKLSPAFVRVAMEEQFSPARTLIESMMPYYEDVDGNFVEQFQSSAFDARFWELYLFALLTEERFVFDRTHSAPDFLCEGLHQDIFVEAVTVGPTRFGNLVIEPEPPDDAASFREYMREYMPIKWAGALTAKLQKEYWKLLHVASKPIVFAVQDFHVPRAMTFTNSTLLPYLYGRSFTAFYDGDSRLHVRSVRIQEHRWQNKTIESGFFYLPGAERISAVVHNPTATISKFNRMGRLAKMGSSAVRMVCFGAAYNHAPDAALPTLFRYDIDDPSYSETWCEGLNVYHNPNAVYPLEPDLFPAAMHHRLSGENVVHTTPRFHPYSSTTLMVVPNRTDQPDGFSSSVALHQEQPRLPFLIGK
jgi:hypothetical protein